MVSPPEKYTIKVRSTTNMSTTTVRVRIFVSVCADGRWTAHGYSEDKIPEKAAVYVTGHAYGDAGYWIEADLPVPGAQPTLTATITRA